MMVCISSAGFCNAKGKYYVSDWRDGSYNKTESGRVLLSTGASSEFERGGIYDLAGNVHEFTLENTNVVRGGMFSNYFSSDSYSSYREGAAIGVFFGNVGFRVALYRDEALTEQPTVVDVVDPIWELGTVDLDAGTIKLRTKDKYFNKKAWFVLF